MKTINEMLENYKDYETFLDDRFGVRLCQFLTLNQIEQIGFSLKDGIIHTPKDFTEQEVLKQLKEDVEFGWEKACDERGISSNLMYEVVKNWCKVLENEFADFDNYYDYGKPLFRAVAKKYNWNLEEV